MLSCVAKTATDCALPPTRVTVIHQGKRIDALAQITKSGFIDEQGLRGSDVPD